MAVVDAELVRFEVNGTAVEVDGSGDVSLLCVLRNDLGLTGSRFGCGLEQCGACTVLVDGEPAYACSRPAWGVAGRSVTTVEDVACNRVLRALHAAFVAEQAGQCGYCLSGIVMSACALIAREPAPSRTSIIAALDRHLCRCGAHNRIIRAVERAASTLASAEAGA